MCRWCRTKNHPKDVCPRPPKDHQYHGIAEQILQGSQTAINNSTSAHEETWRARDLEDQATLAESFVTLYRANILSGRPPSSAPGPVQPALPKRPIAKPRASRPSAKVAEPVSGRKTQPSDKPASANGPGAALLLTGAKDWTELQPFANKDRKRSKLIRYRSKLNKQAKAKKIEENGPIHQFLLKNGDWPKKGVSTYRRPVHDSGDEDDDESEQDEQDEEDEEAEDGKTGDGDEGEDEEMKEE